MFCIVQYTHRFTSLVKFISRYFILLDAIINGIVFLVFFLNFLLLVYGIHTDFCMLILNLATLLSLLALVVLLLLFVFLVGAFLGFFKI